MMDTPRSKSALDDLKSTAFSEDEIARGNPDILEGNVAVPVRSVVVAIDV